MKGVVRDGTLPGMATFLGKNLAETATGMVGGLLHLLSTGLTVTGRQLQGVVFAESCVVHHAKLLAPQTGVETTTERRESRLGNGLTSLSGW